LRNVALCNPHVSLIDVPGASDFAPNRVLIRDSHNRLALGGKVGVDGVEWCAPVTSDDEALRVRNAATELRVESGLESGWDNYSTARDLEGRAQLLEARLVDPFWQAEAANVLRNRMTSVPTAICDSQR
jgi:hypothetical protein